MTSATFTSLSVPAMEDSMEVSSSPAGNQLDVDIDIDFGDYGTATHLTDDERMLEDGEPTRPATATDEMMDDDDQTLNVPFVEEIMHDGPGNEDLQVQDFADEELIDYDDDDTYQDPAQAILDDFTTQSTEVTLSADAFAPHQTDLVDDANARDLERDATVEQTNATLPTEAAQPADEHHAEGTETHEEAELRLESNVDVADDEENEAYDDDTTHEGVTGEFDAPQAPTGDEEQGNQDSNTRKVPPQLPGSLDVGLGHISDGPPTPTDTGLHPASLKFESYEFPLFKSRAQPEGLLKDDNLASLSLATLLVECRQRLAIKTNEIISDEYELSLCFEHLGLLVHEGSRSASGTSLNDVLDVYLMLHENDGAQDIPPLSLILTRGLKFDSSLNILKQGAKHGQGISAFTFPFFGSVAHGSYDEEENVDEEPSYHDADSKETAQGQEDQNDAEGQETHEYESQNEQDYQETVGEGTYDQEGEYDDAEYQEGQFGDYDEDEEYPDPEGYDQEAVAAEEHETEGYPTEANQAAADVPEDAQEVVASESAASSTTARNDDPANDATGEYDPDDIIDWDDDDLTTNSSSETYADDGAEDFSTFLTEYKAEGTQDDAKAQTLPKEDVEPHPQSNEEHAAVDLGSEDLIQYDQPEDEAETEGAEYFNAAGDDLDQYEENNYNQADNLVDNDADELQLGEDDEQFHTAYDLLDGNHTEDLEQNGDTAERAQHTNGADVNEDDIGFDDDVDFGDHRSTAPAATSNSPLGKRSYEDHVDDDELNFDEPDPKKARSD